MEKAQAANYPFCTIEPNIASVVMPDPRLEALSKVSRSEKCIGIQVEWHDIAGLIEGASKGAGLGNAFLGHSERLSVYASVMHLPIQFLSLIIMQSGLLPPSFKWCVASVKKTSFMSLTSPTLSETWTSSKPRCAAQMSSVTEGFIYITMHAPQLILADLQSVEKRLGGGKVARGPDGAATAKLLSRVKELLDAGLPARLLAPKIEPSERAAFDRLQLLTQKPMIWACNVADTDAVSGNVMTAAVKARVAQKLHADAALVGLPAPHPDLLEASVCIVSATLEQEVSALDGSPEDRQAVLTEYGLQRSGLESILQQCGALLHLRYFYTTGPMEARAWAIAEGATAAEAAGVIHSDLQKNFIKADSECRFYSCGGASTLEVYSILCSL